jgi:hypothetical protein
MTQVDIQGTHNLKHSASYYSAEMRERFVTLHVLPLIPVCVIPEKGRRKAVTQSDFVQKPREIRFSHDQAESPKSTG